MYIINNVNFLCVLLYFLWLYEIHLTIGKNKKTQQCWDCGVNYGFL